MRFSKLARLWRTLRYLKLRQIFFRLFYSLRNHLAPVNGITLAGHSPPGKSSPGNLVVNAIRGNSMIPFLPGPPALTHPGRFTFINLTHDFGSSIDWNFSGFKKLWTYHLCYFEYLLQPGLTKEQGVALIHQFIGKLPTIRDGIEPYPASLRIINWVKFCLAHRIADPVIDGSIAAHTHYLAKNPEYHIMGNHLLENAMAWYAGAIYSGYPEGAKNGYRLLIKQLNEQILADGAHYERSAMYHQILLGRLLDVIHIVSIGGSHQEHIRQLTPFASSMLGWSMQICFEGQRIPLINDTSFDVAPPLRQLEAYAHRLGIHPHRLQPGVSGFRKLKGALWEIVVDAGAPGPDYQPGHAHAGALSYELYVKGNPVVVDTGTSTYNPGKRREWERSTLAHNCVTINGADSSEVWASHRVGRRAKIFIDKQASNLLQVRHNGYSSQGVEIVRVFKHSPHSIVITDTVVPAKEGSKITAEVISRIHFHPGCRVKLGVNSAVVEDVLDIHFEGAQSLELLSYNYAPRFNQLFPAFVLEVKFLHKLTSVFNVFQNSTAL